MRHVTLLLAAAVMMPLAAHAAELSVDLHKVSAQGVGASIGTARLKPVVDSVFPLEKWADAMAHMTAGKHFGKVCIRF